MRKVSFGMFWQVYGRQEFEIPDDLDTDDREAVVAYLQEHWDEVALPTDGEYVSGSDELDEESVMDIIEE